MTLAGRPKTMLTPQRRPNEFVHHAKRVPCNLKSSCEDIRKERIMALSLEENEMFTNVGPGTPGGEMLRRYWHPIAFSKELKEKAAGEERSSAKTSSCFVMTTAGWAFYPAVPSPRNVSEFGHLENGGLRCCYHGWLYDVDGRVLERPANRPTAPSRTYPSTRLQS